jgi:hypothetical protein
LGRESVPDRQREQIDRLIGVRPGEMGAEQQSLPSSTSVLKA